MPINILRLPSVWMENKIFPLGTLLTTHLCINVACVHVVAGPYYLQPCALSLLLCMLLLSTNLSIPFDRSCSRVFAAYCQDLGIKCQENYQKCYERSKKQALAQSQRISPAMSPQMHEEAHFRDTRGRGGPMEASHSMHGYPRDAMMEMMGEGGAAGASPSMGGVCHGGPMGHGGSMGPGGSTGPGGSGGSMGSIGHAGSLGVHGGAMGPGVLNGNGLPGGIQDLSPHGRPGGMGSCGPGQGSGSQNMHAESAIPQDFQFLAKEPHEPHRGMSGHPGMKGGPPGGTRVKADMTESVHAMLDMLTEQRNVAAERRTQEAVSHLEDIKMQEIHKDVSSQVWIYLERTTFQSFPTRWLFYFLSGPSAGRAPGVQVDALDSSRDLRVQSQSVRTHFTWVVMLSRVHATEMRFRSIFFV